MQILPPKEFLHMNKESTEAANKLNLVCVDLLLKRAPPADSLIAKLGQTEACRSITKRNQRCIPPELLVSC
jgi:hypothetical protein